MFTFRVETDLAQVVSGAINRMVTYAREQSQEDASRAAIPIIRTRTAMGFDQNGNPFFSYREKYAARKRKAGLRSNPVNLRWSGDMLKSLHYDKSIRGVTVDNNQVGKARGAQLADGPYNRGPRRFMGLRDADGEAIKKILIAKLRVRIMQK